MAIPEKQEPKYSSDQGGIFNRQSGEYIPHDEPVFILRARDVHARDTLAFYAKRAEDEHHKSVIHARHREFIAFAEANPDSMKEPDTDKSIQLD